MKRKNGYKQKTQLDGHVVQNNEQWKRSRERTQSEAFVM